MLTETAFSADSTGGVPCKKEIGRDAQALPPNEQTDAKLWPGSSLCLVLAQAPGATLLF